MAAGGRVPDTHYAQSGDVSIAWSQTGSGPPVVLVGGLLSHIEHFWEEPGLVRFFERAARFSRFILFDRRGSGLSDPAKPDLDAELDDLEAVLDDAGLARASFMGYTIGGPLAIRFAARRPHRVDKLVLLGAVARNTRAEGYEWANDDATRAELVADTVANWGNGKSLERAGPTRADDPRLRSWFAKMERLSMSPGQLAASFEASGRADVRDDLPRITVPTLVLHRRDDALIDVRHSRYIAARIPGARLVEVDGVDSLPWVGDVDALLGEVEEHVAGTRRATAVAERVLRTILFTDVVDATGTAGRLGDARWREALDALEALTDRCLARHAGTRVKSLGDGTLAVFAGPPSQAVRCARQIVEEAAEYGTPLRAGLHLGECEHVGADDIGGLAVHVASRVTDLAGEGEVLVTSTVAEAALGAGLGFEPRGSHGLKGLEGDWRVLRASG